MMTFEEKGPACRQTRLSTRLNAGAATTDLAMLLGRTQAVLTAKQVEVVEEKPEKHLQCVCVCAHK